MAFDGQFIQFDKVFNVVLISIKKEVYIDFVGYLSRM